MPWFENEPSWKWYVGLFAKTAFRGYHSGTGIGGRRKGQFGVFNVDTASTTPTMTTSVGKDQKLPPFLILDFIDRPDENDNSKDLLHRFTILFSKAVGASGIDYERLHTVPDAVSLVQSTRGSDTPGMVYWAENFRSENVEDGQCDDARIWNTISLIKSDPDVWRAFLTDLSSIDTIVTGSGGQRPILVPAYNGGDETTAGEPPQFRMCNATGAVITAADASGPWFTPPGGTPSGAHTLENITFYTLYEGELPILAPYVLKVMSRAFHVPIIGRQENNASPWHEDAVLRKAARQGATDFATAVHQSPGQAGKAREVTNMATATSVAVNQATSSIPLARSFLLAIVSSDPMSPPGT